MAALVYPRTKTEFDQCFSTERKCRLYLERLRWGDGFTCPACKHNGAWRRARSFHQCKSCRRRFSVTAGTVLHGSRYPLRTWLDVAWHVCEQKNGISALGLQRAMGFGSYHTAFRWLHAMRQVMVIPGRSALDGEVEVDETFIGGVKTGKRGRGAAGKVLVLIAAEVRGRAVGRIRLRVIPDASGVTLVDAIHDLIEAGSEVVTDGWSGYVGVAKAGYHHTISRYTPAVGKNLLPKVNRVASLLKRWIMGTHQGSVSEDMLQCYLDEFVFRFNRRTARSRGLLFHRILTQAVSHSPS